MKFIQKIVGVPLLLVFLLAGITPALAESKVEAIRLYAEEITRLGAQLPNVSLNEDQTEDFNSLSVGNSPATRTAYLVVQEVLRSMKASQNGATKTIEDLEEAFEKLTRNDPRREGSVDDPRNIKQFFGFEDLDGLVSDTKDKVEAFAGLNVDNNLKVIVSDGFNPPQVVPSDEFTLVKEETLTQLGGLNTILLTPPKPGRVPDGDLIEDFIPQIVRQLFYFAWLGIFVSFVVAGVMMVISFGNEEMLTKAKDISYYTLIGFAFITLAFAIVKALTDIDFFRFV